MYKYKNIKIFLNYWLGPILFVWLSWSIYHQIQLQPDFRSSWKNAKTVFLGNQAWKCWLAIGMMVLNWGIEAMKWRELLAPVFKLSFHRAFKATLAGVAFAINTPNRVGEYGGRVLYLPEGKRIQAVSLTLIGSYSQLLVTLLMGTVGLWIFYFGLPEINFEVKLASYALWIRLLCLVLSTISLVFLFVYIRISWLVRWIEKIPGVTKWGKSLLVIDQLPVRVLLRVLGWSLLRYVVFVIQYILLLQCFEVTHNIWSAWWLISVMFLFLAIIPSIALAELGIRGKLALELFGWVSANQLGIISAAISIWLVNLVLPAIIGSLLIIRIKIFSTRLPQEN